MNFLDWRGRVRRLIPSAFSIASAVALASAMLPSATSSASAAAIEEAEAAKGPPYHIAIFVSSQIDACYDPGTTAAIKKLTDREERRINRRGGIFGRPIQIDVLDDKRDTPAAIANMRSALAEPQTLALIGLSNSNRAKAVFDALGNDIGTSGIPFISDISVNSIFEARPNVYTTRASQDDDSIPVMATFVRRLGYQRSAVISLSDSVFGAALATGLKRELGEAALVSDQKLAATDGKISEASVPAAIAALKESQPDLLFLNVGGQNAASVIKKLVEAGLTPALFVAGRIDSLPAEVTKTYPNAMFQVAWDQPPDVDNDRLRRLITPENFSRWVFEGAKNEKAPGWAKGECKPRDDINPDNPNPLAPANMRAIATGGQYADMVGLIATAIRDNPPEQRDLGSLRAHVLKQLSTTYAAGRGAYRGSFDTWSFVPASRTAARDPFVIILPQGLGNTQLAQTQFVRTKDGSLTPMDTLYLDIDMIKAHRIDENDKAFFAEFYLSMRSSEKATLDRIEFANAYVDPQTEGGRQILVETIHPGGKSDAYPDTMKIYKVSGRFLFTPQLANYPFDSQRFSIDIQPKKSDAPFIIQPPPLELRDKSVTTDGWNPKAQYVGYEKDFVPVVDAFTHRPSIVPFYKSSFVWLMQRETTDYFLRVAVPLGFILFVAYLSIFIPATNFEAIVTIQVTALLSAVALYLSLPKLESDTATLSDRMFVFAYLIVSVMIFVSILRVSPLFAGRNIASRALEALHIVAIPACIGVAIYYAYGLSIAGN